MNDRPRIALHISTYLMRCIKDEQERTAASLSDVVRRALDEYFGTREPRKDIEIMRRAGHHRTHGEDGQFEI